MIAPSAKLSSGYGAPRTKRRHGQHTMIISPERPRPPPVNHGHADPGWTAATIIGHPGTGHGAGRRTGSTSTARHADP